MAGVLFTYVLYSESAHERAQWCSMSCILLLENASDERTHEFLFSADPRFALAPPLFLSVPQVRLEFVKKSTGKSNKKSLSKCMYDIPPPVGRRQNIEPSRVPTGL